MANDTVNQARRRTVPGLAALLLFALSGALAACGGEPNSGGGATGQSAESNETTQASGDTWSYELPGEEVYPEGIAYQESSGDFFVSSTSNGEIFRGTVEEGGGSAEVFLEGGRDDRSAAIGLELDDEGRLFIAGGETGRMFVYDTENGDLLDSFQNEQESTFVNDVAVVPSGDAYFTDSFSPVLYRLAASGEGYELEEYLNLEGTPIEYQDGFNLNGIVATSDGRYLIVTHSTTGQLFRIDTESEEVTEIDLGGDEVAGDGMILDDRTLYAVAGNEILPVELSEDYASGEVGEGFSDPSFKSPTTIAGYDQRLLVVNSQFDARESGDPKLPFTVSDVPIP
ncbi:MAG TPA: SMP-30/gluconolactonase/LRE family protein [Rubrobacteraceae bacterium]|nr:SMP-30/gluconolactonase/LRE family protein [Rubrobacteraceae bacterium]